MANDLHAEWLKEGVKTWNRRRRKVKFSPDLSGICFFDFLPPDFRDDPKTSRYFEKIDLSNSNLNAADLSGLNFARANFSESDLSEADLSLSNFEKANFKRANLKSVNAINSIFNEAQFEYAAIDLPRFKGSSFENAILIATEIRDTQDDNATIYNAQTFKSSEEFRAFKSLSAFKIKIDQALPPEESGKTKKNKYDVFYATNRDPIYQRGKLVDFGSWNTNKLEYGVCEVIVPASHRIGSLGSPLWKRLWNRQDDRLRVDQIIALDSILFWAFLKENSERMKIKEHPTIFVHGFNTSFEDAVLRSAQIGYDLGIGLGIGLFSWPSKGRFYNYSADEASVEASKYLLAEFIEEFSENNQTQSINLIAHSMGCRCVVGALEFLFNKNKNFAKRINQVILAAADIDTTSMQHQFKSISGKCHRVTSYVSDLDQALKISGWLHRYPRVGVSPPTFVMSGMDTIMVNDLSLGDFSHGYVSTSRTIISDIFSILKSNLPPEDRHALELADDGKASFWRIKK